MPRTAHPMTSISAALQDVRRAFEALAAEQATLRRQMQSIVRRGSPAAYGRVRATPYGAKKRGRAFKFSEEQAAGFRTQVEGGKTAVALARELKVSLPTMYSTLRRAGWAGRRGRPARATRAARSSGTGGTKKLGRAFKFNDDQAAGFRKQVEGGKSALALAKELKISAPTMYNTLKRAGWKGTRGRRAKAA